MHEVVLTNICRYQPAANLANFGCASSFRQQVGMPTCGDSALSINQQGCNMVNTASGPCYLCCCKGGSCNHPQVFAQQAQYAFNDAFPNQHMFGLTGATSSSMTLVTSILILLAYAA
ncbi:unnamed protein product [Auanema sp. JU1783]|nr:unnamed protein product [Auanema sp. JU1783]